MTVRTTVVSGASGALGSAVVGASLRRGDRVIGFVKTEARAASIPAHPSLSVEVLNIRDDRRIRSTARRFLDLEIKIDRLFQCSGVNRRSIGVSDCGAMSTTSRSAIHEMIDINAVGPLQVIRSLVPLLRSPGCLVVNVSSDRGSIGAVADGGNYAYAMSKAALNMATRRLAFDLHSSGICVVSVHPGWFRSAIGGDRAPESAAEAAERLVCISDQLTLEDSGRFIDGMTGADYAW